MCFWPRCYFTVEIGAIGKTADMIRAVQEVSSILAMRSCINVSGLECGAFFAGSGPPWV